MIRLTTTQGDRILIDVKSVIEKVECVEVSDHGGRYYFVEESLEQIEDMILRDQFAMSAMNGIISCSTVATMTYCDLAKSAYSQADAMLKQRKEK